MSSFEDTFTRNNDGDLQYDDSAFYIFSTSVLSSILFIIIIYYIIEKIFKKKNDLEFNMPNSKIYINNLNKYKNKKSNSIFKNLIKLCCILFASYLLFVCISRSKNSKNLKNFDPFEILQIEKTDDWKLIKKAYKKLAKMYHPDRNSGDPLAKQKFVLINKAYKCLTDEEIKAKCEKYGNPDGKFKFEVGIALPKWLMEKKNKLIILALFFLIILVILPTIIFIWYTSDTNKNEKGIHRDSTMNCIPFLNNQNLIFKNIIESLCLSVEFKNILPVRDDQIDDMNKIVDNDFKPKLGLDRFKMYLKPFYIINAYMKKKEIGESLKSDLKFILKTVPKLIESYIEVVIYIKENDINKQLKNISFNTINTLISFSQCFFQGTEMFDSYLLQLPFISKDNINKITKGIKQSKSDAYFHQLLINNENEQENLANLLKLQDEQKKEFLNCFSFFPNFDISIEAYVENEDGTKDYNINLNEIYTISIKIKRKNTLNKINYAFLKDYPFPKIEKIFLIICEKSKNELKNNAEGFSKVLDFRDLVNSELVLEEKMQNYSQNHGKFKMRFLIKSDCYRSLDQQIDFEYEILNKKVEKVEDLHPDDVEALQKKNMFEELKSNLVNNNDEDEEEEEEENKEKEVEEEEIKESNEDKEVKEEIKENKE